MCFTEEKLFYELEFKKITTANIVKEEKKNIEQYKTIVYLHSHFLK